MTGTEEDDLSEVSQNLLAQVFDMVRVWCERIRQEAPEPAADSSLHKDDDVTHPYRLSHHAVWALLSVAEGWRLFDQRRLSYSG